MGRSRRWLLPLLVLVVAAGVWWTQRGDVTAPRLADRGREGGREAAVVDPRATAAPNERVGVELGAEAGSSADETPDVPSTPVDRDPEALVVHVATAGGVAIVDARVDVARDVAFEFSMPPPFARLDAWRARHVGGGEYRAAARVGATYRIQVRCLGFADVERSGLTADEPVEVTLRPAASLRAMVVERETGAPIDGALVRVFHGPDLDSADAITSVGGRATFEGLVPGPAAWRAEPPRHMAARYTEFEFEPGANADLVIEVESGATIRGRVIDGETGRPIEGARVAGSSLSHWHATTDATGHFVLEGAKAGRVGLTAFADGYAPEVFDGVVTNEWVEFRMQRPVAAAGRVVAASDGAPIANATVHVGDGVRFDRRPIESDGDGRFRVEGLHPSGSLILRVDAQGFTSLRHAIALAERTPSGAPPAVALGDLALTEGDGSPMTDDAPPLGEGSEIAGVVVLSSGEPATSAPVTLRRAGAVLRTRTDDAGGFRGTVGPGSPVAVDVGSPSKDHLPAHVASVSPGAVDLRIELRAVDAVVRGRVVEANGRPVEHAAVAIDVGDGGRTRTILADANGEFSLAVPSVGQTRVTAWRTFELTRGERGWYADDMQLGRSIGGRDEHPIAESVVQDGELLPSAGTGAVFRAVE